MLLVRREWRIVMSENKTFPITRFTVAVAVAVPSVVKRAGCFEYLLFQIIRRSRAGYQYNARFDSATCRWNRIITSLTTLTHLYNLFFCCSQFSRRLGFSTVSLSCVCVCARFMCAASNCFGVLAMLFHAMCYKFLNTHSVVSENSQPIRKLFPCTLNRSCWLMVVLKLQRCI